MSDMDPPKGANGSEAPQVTGPMLLDLHRQGVNSATEAAQSRGEYAALVKSKVQTHNLNAQAFRMASQIRKKEDGKREIFYRTLLHYCDLMDVNQQKDFEDRLADNGSGKYRSDLDKELDGQPREVAADKGGKVVVEGSGKTAGAKLTGEFGGGEVVDLAQARVNAPLKPNSPMGKHTLNQFAETIRDIAGKAQIITGLERFCSDHPKLNVEAATIVKDHLRHLGTEAGDGEDLRSDTVKQAEADEVDQAAQVGKRTSKAKARKDTGGETPAIH